MASVIGGTSAIGGMNPYDWNAQMQQLRAAQPFDTTSHATKWQQLNQAGQQNALSAYNSQYGPTGTRWYGGAAPTPHPAATGQMPAGSPVIGGVPTGTTSMNPYMTQAGTSTAQGYSGMPAPANPAPWGGTAPLTSAVQQGLGYGLAGFNPDVYNQLGASLYDRANANFTQSILPQIQQAGQAAGQYGGGSRQALAAGVAGQRLNQQVMDALAPAYAGGYESAMNRGLQAGNLGLTGLLGLGNLDLGAYNAQNQAAAAAANAAGVQNFTSPWASALGGAGMGAWLANLLWGNGG